MKLPRKQKLLCDLYRILWKFIKANHNGIIPKLTTKMPGKLQIFNTQTQIDFFISFCKTFLRYNFKAIFWPWWSCCTSATMKSRKENVFTKY